MAEIGTMNAALLIKIGDGEPFELGTITLEVSGHASITYGHASVEIHTGSLTESLADALEEGAKKLRATNN